MATVISPLSWGVPSRLIPHSAQPRLPGRVGPTTCPVDARVAPTMPASAAASPRQSPRVTPGTKVTAVLKRVNRNSTGDSNRQAACSHAAKLDRMMPDDWLELVEPRMEMEEPSKLVRNRDSLSSYRSTLSRYQYQLIN